MKWIPTSERMPNEAETGNHSRDFLVTIMLKSNRSVVDVANFHRIYGWAGRGGRDANVIAWQLLPDVYEA